MNKLKTLLLSMGLWLGVLSAQSTTSAYSLYTLVEVANKEHFNMFGRGIIITGMTRGADEQAILLWRMYHSGTDLRALYENKKAMDEIIAAIKTNDLDKVEAIVKKQMDAGIYVSKHLCGKGLDIRSWDKTRRQVRKYVDLLNRKYYNKIQAIYEYSPQHIHIELKESCNGNNTKK